MNSSDSSCYFHAQMTNKSQCHSNKKTTTTLRFLRNLKTFWQTVQWNLAFMSRGISLIPIPRPSFICPFTLLFTHPFIDSFAINSFVFIHSFISLVQSLINLFILFIFYSVRSFLFRVHQKRTYSQRIT